MTNRFRRAALGALLLTAAATAPAMAAPLYQLVHTVNLGGSTAWDYVNLDGKQQLVFISHGTEETVVSTASNKVVGTLKGLDGSHNVAVDPATGYIWGDARKTNEVIAFSPKTFKPVAHVAIPGGADGMTYDKASKTIFIAAGSTQGVIAVDPATQTAYPEISVGTGVESLVADGKGNLFVALPKANEIARIDTKTRQVTATWPTTGCTSPTGMALDKKKGLVFTSCHSGTMDVLNADTGAVVATLPIGMGTDSAAFDGKLHRAFSSNRDGTLSVIDDSGATPVALGNVPTMPGARTMAVDPKTGDVYTVTAQIASTTPPATPGGKPKVTYVPGSLELLVYAPSA
ncbi:MAG TPA: YncE family protein [Acidocella sp.]|nr:YncE family protein [Acidocella sp.]